MKNEITRILEEARRAPSVLNSQPWKFRVCGNTIEVYLKRLPELENIDPLGRLQIASCGTLVAYLSSAIRKSGWTPRVNYFPRFEEEDLIAFVEIKDMDSPSKREAPAEDASTGASTVISSVAQLQEGLREIATGMETSLLVHQDGPEHQLLSYFRKQCGKLLEDDSFRKSLNMFLRSEPADHETPYADEVLLSDRFFSTGQQQGETDGKSGDGKRFLILLTKTDNRYAWIRSGEVLGEALMYLRRSGPYGLMALPIMSQDCCREWLRDELSISEYPQFVLTMQHIDQQDHFQKRPLTELLKYGF